MNKSTTLFVYAPLLGLLAFSPAAPPGEAYPPTTSLAEISENLGKVSPEHPRLLAKRSDFIALRESLQEGNVGRSPLR